MFELKKTEDIEIDLIESNIDELLEAHTKQEWLVKPDPANVPILKFRSHQVIPMGRYNFWIDEATHFVDSRIDPVIYDPRDVRYDPTSVGNLYHVSDYRFIHTT